ncbi:MAG: HAMP domain-containing protein [Bacteroidetes bacterium]|nr:HAMP domain-containing protein [Bacteroidota bacterium]
MKWFNRLGLKRKIQGLLLFMFFMLMAFGAVSVWYIDRLTNDSLKEMEYAQATARNTSEISINLNEILYILSHSNASESYRRINLRKNFDRIESYLNMHSAQTSDKKVSGLIEDIREDIRILRQQTKEYEESGEVSVELYLKINYITELIRQLQKINEERMHEQSENILDISLEGMLWLIIIGLLIFFFSLLALIYFPHYIADPIYTLTESIKEITRKNYQQRVELKNQDEFGEMAQSFNHMAEKLNDYEKMNVAQLLVEKKRIEAIIGEMQEAIIGLDAEQKVLFANATASGLLGMPEDQMLGKSLRTLSHSSDLLREINQEMKSGSLQENRTYPTITLHQNGKTYYFDKEILEVEGKVEGENGTTGEKGTVIILKNITEFREKDLKKTNLMATVSHELKTPISAIDMSIGLLEDDRIGPLNEEQKELTQTIRQNSGRLLNMVNEILDLSRIESGNISLELEDCKPEEIVKKALNSTLPQFENKQVKLHKHMERDLPLLHVDIQKTTSVLINFLTNALRYSKTGQQVDIDVRKVSGNVMFTVTDQGPGITEEDQEKIFNQYSRAKNDKTQGTGLGLSIAKEFITKQGGRIWVRSEVGKGSTFGFQLDGKRNG